MSSESSEGDNHVKKKDQGDHYEGTMVTTGPSSF